MAEMEKDPLLQVESACRPLVQELKVLWDEVGESEADRDRMLLELERECLEIYRKKVDQANCCRAQIKQAIADSEAELAAICYSMGERPSHIRQTSGKAENLKEELRSFLPLLDEMRKRKLDRKTQFLDTVGQIQKVYTEIHGSDSYDSTTIVVDENDLSLRRLEELQRQLHSLQKEKSDRLKEIANRLSDLSSLCSVLGLDFKETVREIHPSLVNSSEMSSIGTDTLESLESAIRRLRELKLQRMQKVQDLATMLLELWNLMDTSAEEQLAFNHVTCNIAASEEEITSPNMLSGDFIKYVETEVSRLEEHKSTKLKEIILKKSSELEEICQRTHLIREADSRAESLVAAVESGALDPASVLEQIELEVAQVKEEAFSRKDILEKVEKWLLACEEEEWLDQYNMDENRFSAGHLTLKRAEKARSLVHKIPGMVEGLTSKIQSWENERGVQFMYDGSPLLSIIDEHITSRQEKEHQKKRQREQKKHHVPLVVGQEALSSSKQASPLKSSKRVSRMPTGSGSIRAQTPQSARSIQNSRSFIKEDSTGTKSTGRRDFSNLRAKNNSFNGRETDSTMLRRPASPACSIASARAYDDDFDDLNISQSELHAESSQ